MKVFSKIATIAFALLFAFSAYAEEVDVSKLPDSILTGAQITELFPGKDVSGRTRKGYDIVYSWNKNGYFFLRSPDGYSDSGTWKVEAENLCITSNKGNNSCPTVVTVVSGKIRLGEWFIQK